MLTKDEAELYDRQIRLWGVNAQTKLRQSKVLMLGFNGVASEVAKILVLAGIDTLTIIDNEPLQEVDLSSNLFCRQSTTESQFRTHAVCEKLKVLNPLVQVKIINEPITSTQVYEILPNHDLVSLHTFLNIDGIVSLNDKCRSHHIKFYIAVDFGLYAFMFSDLGDEFKFTYEDYSSSINHSEAKGKDSLIDISDDEDENQNDLDEEDDRDDESKPRKRQRIKSPSRNDRPDSMQHKMECLRYSSFDKIISLEGFTATRQTSPVMIISIAMFKYYDKFERLPKNEAKDDVDEFEKILNQLKEISSAKDAFKRLDSGYIDNINGSLSPVCAVIGGIAGQDMIRALSLSGIPIYNTFSFDGVQMSGKIEKVGLNETRTGRKIQPVVRDFVEIDVDDDDVECQKN